MPTPRDLNPTGHPPVALVASAATAEGSEAKREGEHLGHTNQSDQRPRQPSPGGAIHPATLLVGALDGTATLLRVGTGAAIWRASPRREVGALAHLL